MPPSYKISRNIKTFEENFLHEKQDISKQMGRKREGGEGKRRNQSKEIVQKTENTFKKKKKSSERHP